MKIFEQKGTSRSAAACGYCRTVGHNIRDCSQVGKDYAFWKDYKVPLQAGNPCRWFNVNQPKYWGEWYTKCINAMQKQLDYKESLKKPKKARPKRKPTCGFCGSEHHNRRNCDKMKTFLKEAGQANENWRRAAYALLVTKLGISVGAAIKVKKDRYYINKDKDIEKVALVTDVNWDKLNLSCANGRWGDYMQGLSIGIMIDGRRCSLSFSRDFQEAELQPVFSSVDGYGSWKYDSKIANAPKPLDESWVNEYKEAFDYLAKKRSHLKLQEEGIIRLVAKWK